MLAAGVGLLVVLAGLGRLLSRDRPRVPAPAMTAGALTVVVWGWASLQTLPVDSLPAWLGAHPFWAAAAAGGLDVVPAIGLGAEAGRDAFMRLMAYGSLFWAACLLLRPAERARWVLTISFAVAALYAAYGLLNHFAGWNSVLWESEPKASWGAVTATFINRNNYATYANLGILVGLVLLLEPFLRAGSLGDMRRTAVEVAEKLLEKRGPLLVGLVLLLTASLLTASRGGFLSLALAAVVLLLLVVLITRPRVAVGASAILGAAAIGGVLVWLSGSTLLERLGQGLEAARLPIYQDTIAMITDRPWLGHGYGNFERSFPLHQEIYRGPYVVDKAHNTYLEHAAELGVPAAVLLYLGPFILFLFCLRGVFIRRKDKIFPLLAVCATVLVAVHSLVDFSLQIPAVAMTYAMILGIGVAQSMPSPKANAPGASLRE
jgi:O-antigen ligase